MKVQIRGWIFGAVLLGLLISLTVNPAYSAKLSNLKPVAGRDKEGLNTILNGIGIPKSTIGRNGDFYIDIKNFNFYGPKKNGKWNTGFNLRGPQGSSGIDGKPGERGAGASGSAGAKGEKGDKGERGEAGSPGASGPAGSIGATGPAGATGATGPAGSVGATGATGPAGSVGATGATGPAGSAGATGAKGDTGDIGPQGISNVSIVPIDTFSVSTSIGTSTLSSFFGSLAAGKKYYFEIFLQGIVASGDGRDKVYGASIEPSVSGVDLDFSTSITEGKIFQNSAARNMYFFRITGTLITNTSSNSIRVSIYNHDGELQAMTVSGKARFLEVGSITS
jgi:hypothetical protein